MFIISKNHFLEVLNRYLQEISKIFSLNLDNNSAQQIQQILRSLYQEYYNHIFESQANLNAFKEIVSKNFSIFFKSQPKILKLEKEFEEMITSRSFYNLLILIQKIFIFLEFYDPKLIFNNEKNYVIGNYKNSECLCVDGYTKPDKNVLVLLHPPKMNNGYNFLNLKPIVIFLKNANSDQPQLINESYFKKKVEKSKPLKISIDYNCIYYNETLQNIPSKISIENNNNFNQNFNNNSFSYFKININEKDKDEQNPK